MNEKDPNQGEGDRTSARRYAGELRSFISRGKVPDAAKRAREYVDKDPAGAARDERKARRGPRLDLDELIARGRTIIDRVRAAVERYRKHQEK